LGLQVDANGAYRLSDPDCVDALTGLDGLDLACLEQPLPADDLTGHAALAARIRTPVCLDESITSLGSLEAALGLGACRVVCVKPGPLGGLLRAVEAHDICLGRGVGAWVGGMLETGLGRSANAALAGLPGFTLVGDIAGGERFVEDDPFGHPVMDRGRVAVSREPAPWRRRPPAWPWSGPAGRRPGTEAAGPYNCVPHAPVHGRTLTS
jgi:O-succinylbenzoate synthase